MAEKVRLGTVHPRNRLDSLTVGVLNIEHTSKGVKIQMDTEFFRYLTMEVGELLAMASIVPVHETVGVG